MKKMMDAAELGRMLEELDEELKYSGAKAVVYVFGGAAMILGYGSLRTTDDIDGIISSERHGDVMRAIKKVGRNNGVAEDWLNETGTAAVPKNPDLGQTTVHSGRNLTVRAAGRRHLTAMKLEAGRKIDQEDLMRLVQRFGPRNPKELVEVHREAYGGRHEKDAERLEKTGEAVFKQIEDRARKDQEDPPMRGRGTGGKGPQRNGGRGGPGDR